MTATRLTFKLFDHISKHVRLYISLLLIAYLIFGFWPFNFKEKNNAVISPAGGLTIARHGMAYTAVPSEKIHSLKQFTIYIDLTTTSNGLSAFERIFSYAITEKDMNFIVGQWKNGCSFHLPDEKRQRVFHFGADDLLKVGERLGLLISYDGTKLAMYQDGKVRKYRETGPLSFNGWSKEYPLVIGTDADGKAHWKGTIYEIAIYDRALTSEEVKHLSDGTKGHRLQAAGYSAAERQKKPQAASRKPRKDVTSDQWPVTSEKDENKRPLVHYVFKPEYTYEAEFRGKKAIGVMDLGKGEPADLVIPEYFLPYKRAYLKWDIDWATIKANWQDTVVNVVGFIPFGVLMYWALVKRNTGLSGQEEEKRKVIDKKRLAYIVILAVVVGFGVSFAIEYTQAYLPTRDSSLRDLLANTLGTLLGAAAAAWYPRKGFGLPASGFGIQDKTNDG